MTQDIWTVDMEEAFQNLRRTRNGKPFADSSLEAAYQATKKRRYEATPSEEVRDLQLTEQRGQ